MASPVWASHPGCDTIIRLTRAERKPKGQKGRPPLARSLPLHVANGEHQIAVPAFGPKGPHAPVSAPGAEAHAGAHLAPGRFGRGRFAAMVSVFPPFVATGYAAVRATRYTSSKVVTPRRTFSIPSA